MMKPVKYLGHNISESIHFQAHASQSWPWIWGKEQKLVAYLNPKGWRGDDPHCIHI